jgi:rhomboid protease GluP
MLFLIALIVIGGYVFFFAMSSEERARLLRGALAAVRNVKDEAISRHTQSDPFQDGLRERTPWAIVTLIIAALNVTIFTGMLFSAGAFSDPQTLLAWGADFAPRTTNGEWWRLVTAMFVHGGLLSVLVNVAALFQLGMILERLVGHFAFGVVYLAAGLFASLLNLSTHALAVNVGASGPIFGLYGLLIACAIWGLVDRSPFTIPLTALKRIAPVTIVFLLYNAAAGGLDTTAVYLAIGVGLVIGLVFAKNISEQQPPVSWVAVTMAGTLVIAVLSAISLRGVADVKPEIERMIALEDRTASSYQTAVNKFRKGWMTADALAKVIDGTIRPELQATRERLKAIRGVPQEQQALVASADEYLRLRDESWRLRSDALHASNMRTLRIADRTEQASLEAFEKIRPADK